MTDAPATPVETDEKHNPFPPGTPEHLAHRASASVYDLQVMLARTANAPFADVEQIRLVLGHLEDALAGIGNIYDIAGRSLTLLNRAGNVRATGGPDSPETAEALERSQLHRASAQQATEKAHLAAHRTTVALMDLNGN